MLALVLALPRFTHTFSCAYAYAYAYAYVCVVRVNQPSLRVGVRLSLRLLTPGSWCTACEICPPFIITFMKKKKCTSLRVCGSLCVFLTLQVLGVQLVKYLSSICQHIRD